MHARIYGILAPKANKVVLFRRGPSRLTLQLVWDLSTDEVFPGQWIKGNVQVYRCDVSPDCRYLVGGFMNYSHSRENLKPDPRRSTEGWTAISRPPFYSALALYYKKGANGGGHLGLQY